MTTPRTRSGEQLNVRIPGFAREDLRRLHKDLEAKDDQNTSEPELVAALIHCATRAAALAALKRYRRRLRR
jgi:hypothetical protein